MVEVAVEVAVGAMAVAMVVVEEEAVEEVVLVLVRYILVVRGEEEEVEAVEEMVGGGRAWRRWSDEHRAHAHACRSGGWRVRRRAGGASPAHFLSPSGSSPRKKFLRLSIRPMLGAASLRTAYEAAAGLCSRWAEASGTAWKPCAAPTSESSRYERAVAIWLAGDYGHTARFPGNKNAGGTRGTASIFDAPVCVFMAGVCLVFNAPVCASRVCPHEVRFVADDMNLRQCRPLPSRSQT